MTMGFVEGIGDLACKIQCLVDGNRTAFEAIGQCLAIKMLHDEERNLTRILRESYFAGGRGSDVIQNADMRMIQRRDVSRFALKSRFEIGIVGQCGRQDLDRDGAIEPRISRFVDFAHSARPERRLNGIRTKSCTGGKSHNCAQL